MQVAKMHMIKLKIEQKSNSIAAKETSQMNRFLLGISFLLSNLYEDNKIRVFLKSSLNRTSDNERNVFRISLILHHIEFVYYLRPPRPLMLAKKIETNPST